MSTKKKPIYDWDHDFKTSSAEDVWRRSIACSLVGLPSMYSKCRSFLYLSSADIGIEIDDEEELKFHLRTIPPRFKKALEIKDYELAHICEREFHELCDLLYQLGSSSNILLQPDALLELDKLPNFNLK